MMDDIEKVLFSMCTRIISSSGFGGGLRTIAHIDMDIFQSLLHLILEAVYMQPRMMMKMNL